MSNETNAGIEDPGARERPARTVGARTLRTVIAVLVVVLVLSLAGATWMWSKARAADERRQDKAAASAAASQFALRMDKVDGTKFDAYIKSINELLTTKAKADNSKVFDVMKQSYAAAKVKGSGKVLLTAVGDADDDSATILVVHDASVTTTQGKIDHHYRWTVSMVKVRGKWLVDDFNPVN